MPSILSVSELTRRVKDSLEAEFPFVWVKGQVSNLARPSSGHIYFTLKDREASLSVVWFRNRQFGLAGGEHGGAAGDIDGGGAEPRIHPLTGEVLEGPPLALSDGMEALCAGRLTVYPPRGSYQLAAELVQMEGAGDLHLAFEALKRTLAERGWFDLSRKRALPPNPDRVAVVTAPGGAAIRDFLRLAEGRGLGAEIRVFPTLVQGEAAPDLIAEALARACADGWPQAVALIRGGGSIEDLWAFNTEAVAKAVLDCPVPVVCGVGHEIDTTIADLVADLRAATPSHAAQLLWTEREALAQAVDDLELSLRRAFDEFHADKGRELAGLVRSLGLVSPARRLEGLSERFAGTLAALRRAGEDFLGSRERDLERQVSRLSLDGPLRRLQAREEALCGLGQRLGRAARAFLSDKAAGFETVRAGFLPLDPEAPLARGYGLVRVRRTGRFLRHPGEVAPGDGLDITVSGGRVAARVEADEAEAGPEAKPGKGRAARKTVRT